MRLDTYLQKRFVGLTKSDATSAILEGRVSVNGKVVKQVSWNIILQSDEEKTLRVKGFEEREERDVFHRMLLVHKPERCISMRFKGEKDIALTDVGRIRKFKSKGITCIYDVVPEQYRHPSLSGFGRLDKDTTGIYIMGTDGGLQNIIMGPNNSCEKVYIADIEAKCFSRLHVDASERFEKGLVIGSKRCLPAKLEILDSVKIPYHSKELEKLFGIYIKEKYREEVDIPEAPPCPSRVRITIREGMYHQVKRMIKECGSKVLKLHRERVGIFNLLDYPELEKPNSVLEFTSDMMNRMRTNEMAKNRVPASWGSSRSLKRRRQVKETKEEEEEEEDGSSKKPIKRKRCDDHT